jgi:prolyl 4-hydroxylase
LPYFAHIAGMADADRPIYHEPTIPFAQQRSDLRAEFSRSVGQQLDSTSGLWKLTSSPDRPIQLYVRGGFLSRDECRDLCEKIEGNSVPSPVLHEDKYTEARTSHTCYFNSLDPLIADVDRRVSALLGLDPSLGESLQGQRYFVGQEFKDHSDFFYIDQPYWPETENQGGQRTWTAMIYLNEPAGGGATRFKYLNLSIAPTAGRIVIWNNLALDGSPNPWTMHAGEPVTAGSKYILTKWYRERQFV